MCPKTSASCIMPSNWRRRVQSENTLILVLVVFARFIIKTWMVPVQSHKLLTFLSSPLVLGHIYMWQVETFISVRGHTNKNINITTCTNTCHLIGLPLWHSWLESDENWTRPIFLTTLSDGVAWCFRGWYTIRHSQICSYPTCRMRHIGPCIIGLSLHKKMYWPD